MAEIDVTINGRTYQIGCDNGQESHLAELATYVDHKVAGLVASVGQVGDARLLVMVCLLIADELADAYTALDDTKEIEHGAKNVAQGAESRAAQALSLLAERIEGIAARLEAA